MSFNTIFYIHTRKKKHRKIVIVRKTKIINLRSWKSKYSRSFTVKALLWNKCDLWLQLHPRHFCFNHLITSWNMFFAFDVIYIYICYNPKCVVIKGKARGVHYELVMATVTTMMRGRQIWRRWRWRLPRKWWQWWQRR